MNAARNDHTNHVGDRLRKQTETLLQIARAPAIQDGRIDDALALITRAVADVLDVRFVNILRIDPSDKAFTSLSRYDHRNACHLECMAVPAETLPVYLEAIRSGEIIEAADARSDIRLRELREIYILPMGIMSMLDAGFRIGRDITGVLCIASTEARQWHDDEIRFVLAVASQISLAVSNHELQRLSEEHEELNSLSCEDPLTGIGNRRHFDRSFQLYWQQSAVSGKPLSLVIIDLDHFKNLNDQYGHLAGDACLKQFAARFRDSLRRQSDVLARIGGEEFGLLLPDTSLEDACRLVDRLLVETAATGIRLPDEQCVSIGFSAGAACRDGRTHSTPSCLYKDADRALYAAKAAGRGRCIAAADLE